MNRHPSKTFFCATRLFVQALVSHSSQEWSQSAEMEDSVGMGCPWSWLDGSLESSSWRWKYAPVLSFLYLPCNLLGTLQENQVNFFLARFVTHQRNHQDSFHLAFFQSQNRPAAPFLLIISEQPNLSANLVTRGPFPLNVLHMVPGPFDLQEFGESMTASIKQADGLTVPGYAGAVAECLKGDSFGFIGFFLQPARRLTLEVCVYTNLSDFLFLLVSMCFWFSRFLG